MVNVAGRHARAGGHWVAGDGLRSATALTAGIRRGGPCQAIGESDLFAGFHGPQGGSDQSGQFDLIASNPPYIGRREASTLAREVRDHEPEIALYGGEEGYELYASLVAQSATHLKPGGLVVVELGHDSLPAVQPLFDTPHWANIDVTHDLAGIPRVLSAERSSK